MNFKITTGNFMRYGVSCDGDKAVFTFEAEKDDECSIVLNDIKNDRTYELAVPSEYALGSLRSVTVQGFRPDEYAYYYMINQKKVIDTYATKILGRDIWNDASRTKNDYEIVCGADCLPFDWGSDLAPEVSCDRMCIYKLHVRGFSMDMVSSKHPGTFAAVSDKVSYIKKMGFTTLLLMPVYEFEEMDIPAKNLLPEYVQWDKAKDDVIACDRESEPSGKVNFWGYVPGNYFAVKSSYASNPAEASVELKKLVKKLHKNGMECILEMYFPNNINHNMVLEALRYWVINFHVDGFRLIGDNLPITAIMQDGLLSRTKILYRDFDLSLIPDKQNYQNLYIDREEYMYPARMMLNHINCSMVQLLNQQRKQGEKTGFINYISSNNGFTLADIFMYNDRHNEDNGENNLDGPSANFSNNYGCEGPTRKKFIRDVRALKWRDAVMLLFLAQGTPMIMAGDEFCNSQAGNNNAYCQDNVVGWINWENSKSKKNNIKFLSNLINFRNEHPVIANPRPFKFSDYKALGYPDISYHGKNAWIGDSDLNKLCVGVMYCGDYCDENNDFVYIGYNFYSSREKLALPKLLKGKKWYVAADASLKDGFYTEPKECENQHYVDISPQSVCILVGK